MKTPFNILIFCFLFIGGQKIFCQTPSDDFYALSSHHRNTSSDTILASVPASQLEHMFSESDTIPHFPSLIDLQLPVRRKSAVYRFEYYVSPSHYDYSVLAKIITRGCEDDYQRLEALYLWTCDNIRYDAILDARTADHVWNSRTAVCQGYCELIYRMARSLGIKIDLVNGQSKRPVRIPSSSSTSSTPSSSSTSSTLSTHLPSTHTLPTLDEHVWLCARIDGRSILLDPTWGAGYTYNGRFRKSRNPMKWFDVAPAVLIRTHYPEYKKFQLLKPVVEKDTFLYDLMEK